MMNPEFKQPWIDALRSGKYEQGKGLLRTEDNKYCCLGVLCEVAGELGVLSEGYELNRYRYDYDCEVLSNALLDRFGLDTHHQDALTIMNDGDATSDEVDEEGNLSSKSFTEIADWIEKNL